MPKIAKIQGAPGKEQLWSRCSSSLSIIAMHYDFENIFGIVMTWNTGCPKKNALSKSSDHRTLIGHNDRNLRMRADPFGRFCPEDALLLKSTRHSECAFFLGHPVNLSFSLDKDIVEGCKDQG